mgnify:CR=1 FL=1
MRHMSFAYSMKMGFYFMKARNEFAGLYPGANERPAAGC